MVANRRLRVAVYRLWGGEVMAETAECAVDRNVHTGVFNLDVIESGELPMFCHCGAIEWQHDDERIDWASPKRWILLAYEGEANDD